MTTHSILDLDGMAEDLLAEHGQDHPDEVECRAPIMHRVIAKARATRAEREALEPRQRASSEHGSAAR